MNPYISTAPAAGSRTHSLVTNRQLGSTTATPNIADRFTDLLAPLSPRGRRGLIARLAQG